MGRGVGLPEGFGFGVHLWFVERESMGPFPPMGRALDLSLGVGLVWRFLLLAALTSWRPCRWRLVPQEALASVSFPSTLGTAVGPETFSCRFLGASTASSCLSVVASLAPWWSPLKDGGGVGDLSKIFSLG